MFSISEDISVRVNGELISSLFIKRSVLERLSLRGGDGDGGDGGDGDGDGDGDVGDFICLEELGVIIDDILLVQHARSMGFVVCESDLYDEVLRRRGFGEGFYYSGEEFAWKVHNDMLISLLFGKLVEDILSLDDSSLEEYYESNSRYFSCGEAVWVRHILLERGDDVDMDKRMRDRAVDLLGRIRSGADFVFMAKEFSHCPSACRGGDLGYVYRGALGDDEFEESLFLLGEGKLGVLGMIDSSFGYHIVEFLGRTDNFVPPFISISGRVRDFLVERVGDERLENLVEELWSEASIEYIGV